MVTFLPPQLGAKPHISFSYGCGFRQLGLSCTTPSTSLWSSLHAVTVPASLLERLLDVQRFNCPHCKEGQQLNPDVLASVLQKSRNVQALVRFQCCAIQQLLPKAQAMVFSSATAT